MSYSIFDHAQKGHAPEHRTDKPAPKTTRPPKQESPAPAPRKRPVRGWAVEIGLGLGPAFHKR